MTASSLPSLPPLAWLRAFEAAARRLNFTAAGQEIGLTQAAISQQIRLLEAHLGVSLFRRHRRGVELTAEGGAYLPHVHAAFAQLARSTEALFGAGTHEPVSLRSPISFAALWLAPRLADFRNALPGVELSVATIHLPADYQSAGDDFDIRFGGGAWPGRTAHRLTTERLTPVCAPGLRSGGRTPEPFWWHTLPRLSVSGAREMWPDWFALEGTLPPQQPALRFDSFIAAKDAAVAGAGVLLGSRPLVDRTLEAGTLVRLSPLELQSASGHFITHAADRSLSPLQQRILHWFLREASNGDAP